MHTVVVAAADRQEVVEVGWAAVLPPPDVMHLRASEPRLTARDRGGRVQGPQHPSLRGAGEPLGATQVPVLGRRPHRDHMHLCPSRERHGVRRRAGRRAAPSRRSACRPGSTWGPLSTTTIRPWACHGAAIARQQRDHREPGEILLPLDRIVGPRRRGLARRTAGRPRLGCAVIFHRVHRVAREVTPNIPESRSTHDRHRIDRFCRTGSSSPCRRRTSTRRRRSNSLAGNDRASPTRASMRGGQLTPGASRRPGATHGSPRRRGNRHVAGPARRHGTPELHSASVRPRSITRSPVLQRDVRRVGEDLRAVAGLDLERPADLDVEPVEPRPQPARCSRRTPSSACAISGRGIARGELARRAPRRPPALLPQTSNDQHQWGRISNTSSII